MLKKEGRLLARFIFEKMETSKSEVFKQGRYADTRKINIQHNFGICKNLYRFVEIQ